MRRWFTIFLLILLPCQFTWAAAAAYCQHEKSTAARHIGHHEHEHKAHADTPQPSKATLIKSRLAGWSGGGAAAASR